MDLRHLQAFVAVAEESSFRKASERLYIAQPALSRTIQALEQELEVKLFERTTRSVRVTEPGRYLLERAHLIFKQVEDAKDGTRRVARGEQGELLVGFNDFTISDKLPSIIVDFRARYPDINLDLKDGSSREMMDMVLDRRLDIGFLSGLSPAPELDSLVLRREVFVAVLPAGHRLAGKTKLKVKDLASENFVLGYESWEIFLNAVYSYCDRAGFRPNVVQTAVHSDGIINLVAAGIGVTIYVDRDWLHRRADILVKPLTDPQPVFESLAVWRGDTHASSLKYLLEVTQQQSDPG